MMEKDDSPLGGQEPKRKRQEKPGVPSAPSVRLQLISLPTALQAKPLEHTEEPKYSIVKCI